MHSTMKDQLHRELSFEKIPTRIISLVPSQTELLVDLGLESQIVGVTKFCVHPKHLRQSKTIVGGTKQVHVDKIKALNPDIILCNKEENTKDMIAELEQISTVHVSDVYTVEDALELIVQYGELFSVRSVAENLCYGIKEEIKRFNDLIHNKKEYVVAYFIWKNPWMVAASHTFIDALLSMNKFENYFAKLKRYPEVNLDNLTDHLDLILLSSEPYPFKQKHVKELKSQFPKAQILVVDGEYFSWFGSRLLGAFKYFEQLQKQIQPN